MNGSSGIQSRTDEAGNDPHRVRRLLGKLANVVAVLALLAVLQRYVLQLGVYRKPLMVSVQTGEAITGTFQWLPGHDHLLGLERRQTPLSRFFRGAEKRRPRPRTDVWPYRTTLTGPETWVAVDSQWWFLVDPTEDFEIAADEEDRAWVKSALQSFVLNPQSWLEGSWGMHISRLLEMRYYGRKDQIDWGRIREHVQSDRQTLDRGKGGAGA